MAQTDELWFEVPQEKSWQEALQSLDAIARNTERTASFSERMNSELWDANSVAERLQTESENHSTALLLVLQNTERTAFFAERITSELQDVNDALGRLQLGSENPLANLRNSTIATLASATRPLIHSIMDEIFVRIQDYRTKNKILTNP
ncbi:hypothetical protein WAI453_010465 [Rhynchosporium graminicola]